jgi:DNA-binding transcriptional LysR family regulator
MADADPSWDLYRSFLAVLRAGSLSAAARALALTQPTVGRHITQLQKLLGKRVLFTRSPDGLLPTAAARELRMHAEAMEAAAAALQRAATADLKEVGGVVRIAAADVMGVEVLPEILSEFRQEYPATAIELATSNQMADLLRRDADIAVRMVPPQQKALVAKRVGSVALGFHAHRRYLDRYGQPQQVEDLSQHALIGFDRIQPAAPLLKVLPLPVTRDLFAFRCDNDLAQLAALRAGFGIGVCQRGIAQRDANLVPLLRKEFRVDLDVWIVMHEDLRRSPGVRSMFNHLVAALTRYTASQDL